jgi:CrcB protein
MISKIHPIILVGLGGLFGAILRYLITLSLKNYQLLPIGTLVVNVTGGFALGAVFALLNLQVIDATWIPLIGTGFMGSFTTMSSFAVETLDLSASNSLEIALITFLLMMGLVFVGAFIGRGFVTIFYPIILDLA